MKKYLFGVLGIVISIFVVVVMKDYIVKSGSDFTYVSAAIFGTDSKTTIPTETGEKGTAANPFVILEIVPYEGYAEIGYMIKGCEPVPMEQLAYSSDGAVVASTGGMGCVWEPEYTFDIPTGDKVGTVAGEWENIGNQTQYGYYQKVEVGKGTFKQQVSGTVISFVETTTGDGNYTWVAYTVNKADPTKTTDYSADQVHTSRQRTYYRRYHNVFTYHNKFLINTLNVPADKVDNYKIQVVTFTPKELNIASNQAWIDRSDLIYISPRDHFNGDLTKVWNKFYTDKIVSNPPTSFVNNDFTWETTVKILKKASTVEGVAPIVFDVRVFTEDNSYSNNIAPTKYYSSGSKVDSISSKGYVSNIAKLYMIMQQMEPAKFVHEYIDTNQVVSVKVKNSSNKIIKNGTIEMTTGFYKEQYSGTVSSSTQYELGTAQRAAVWSIYTFLPFQLYWDYNALNNNTVWATLGIDNWRVIVDGGASNVSVRHNFYSYNGDNSITQHFLNGSKITSNDYSKELYEYYGISSSTITLSPAQALHFLLKFGSPVYSGNTLRILEIEPCNDFIWNETSAVWSVSSTKPSYARQFFTKFFPNFSGNISITKMTSSEFIGRIDDLNSTYDLIFFGLKDGVLRKSGTTTIYNDTNLNGRVYLHNGDIVKDVDDKLRGLSNSSTLDKTDAYRFSGNDITAAKLSQLKKFMQGGNPIILDKGFYTDSSRTSVNKGTNGLIDPNSNIYNLAALNYSQLFYTDGISSNKVESYLSVSKCKIKFGKINDSSVTPESCYPAVYRDRTQTANAGYTDSQIYINGVDPNLRTLQYQFYIDDSDADTAYTVKLYIDINADGKYDELTENVSGLNILNDKSYKVDYNNLKVGVNYTVTRTLEADYYGVLPWKLVIASNSNKNECDSVINYSALKSKEKIQLNILQIMSDTKNTVDLSTQPVFQKYIANLYDYDIKIISKTVSDFSSSCGTGAYTYLLRDSNDNSGMIKDASKVVSRIDDDGDGLNDYDMIILGFADMYSDVSNANALKNFSDFIEEGNTVLFTHDTTSFVNQPKGTYSGTDFWGYNLNKYFRDSFGMDRFGVMLSNQSDRIAAGKDYSGNTSDVSSYIQGYSNLVLDRYAPSTYRYYYNRGNNYDDIIQNGSHINSPLDSNFDFEGNFTTNRVTSVNKGQLTTYPYKIADNFQVATTHAQYYQLDLEDDDIVVWYCLSDSKSGSGLYSTTPNDVRNNYYIYNKGNITYSGVGHSALNSSLTDTSNHTEVKLFVNTIIAAYTATAKEAQIDITNANKSIDSNGKQYVYVDYDIYNTQQAVGSDVTGSASQYQRIKYRVADYNILFNKVLTVKYYYSEIIKNADGTPAKNADGTTKIQETEITGLSTNRVSDSDVAKTSDKGSIIESGEEYYFEIPLSEMNTSNSGGTIVIKVLTTYGKASDKTTKSQTSFSLIRRGLFDLD